MTERRSEKERPLTDAERDIVAEFYGQYPKAIPVVRKLWPGIYSEAKRQIDGGLYTEEDLEQYAWEAVCHGVKRYRADMGAKPSTYLVHWFLQSISRLIGHWNRRFRRKMASLDAPVGTMIRRGSRSNLHQMIASRAAAADMKAVDDRIDAEEALSRIKDSEREVVNMLCYDGMNMAEVGKKLDVSRERVRQIVLRAERRVLGLPQKKKTAKTLSNHLRVVGRGRPCVHCKVRKITRARMLCFECGLDPEVRKLHPKLGGITGRRRGEVKA